MALASMQLVFFRAIRVDDGYEIDSRVLEVRERRLAVVSGRDDAIVDEIIEFFSSCSVPV